MTLPLWIEKIAKESSTSAAAFNPRLVQALAIAWEGLQCGAKGSWQTKDFQEAMRRITELGEPQ